ncbi:hypothetical protein NL676_026107 [Syzygium grande]|nr:hypothetical protein NL676_026107 [Syzygium grande]
MALEAVVYPQDPFGYGRDQYYALAGGLQEFADEKAFLDAFNDDPSSNNGCWDYYSSSSANTSAMHGVSISTSSQCPAVDPNSSSPETTCATAATEAGSGNGNGQHSPSAAAGAGGGGGAGGGRRKRRRSRSSKNKEEIENQRMTHIAVERNRRKQMNEYLAVLRSLMPPSYSQRGDQASIIGGAINFVKELEQLLQSMQTHKSKPKPLQDIAAATTAIDNNSDIDDVSSPFAEFFSFPQYSTRSAPTQCGGLAEPDTALEDRGGIHHHHPVGGGGHRGDDGGEPRQHEDPLQEEAEAAAPAGGRAAEPPAQCAPPQRHHRRRLGPLLGQRQGGGRVPLEYGG